MQNDLALCFHSVKILYIQNVKIMYLCKGFVYAKTYLGFVLQKVYALDKQCVSVSVYAKCFGLC